MKVTGYTPTSISLHLCIKSTQSESIKLARLGFSLCARVNVTLYRVCVASEHVSADAINTDLMDHTRRCYLASNILPIISPLLSALSPPSPLELCDKG